MSKKLIRTRLREWRKENKMTRAAVAAALNVSPRTVEAWEQGKLAVNERSAQQIEQLIESSDTLEIPLSTELKEKMKRVRAAGHDPVKWAADVLGKMVPSLFFLNCDTLAVRVRAS